MAEQAKRSLDEIAYDPKPGDTVRIEDARGVRVYSVRDVRFSIVSCEVDGSVSAEIALAEWYAICRNANGHAGMEVQIISG